MGGSAEQVTEQLQKAYRPGLSLEEALRVTTEALGTSESGSRVIPVESLEVAVLDRTRTQQRKFKRLRPAQLRSILGSRDEAAPEASDGATLPGGEEPASGAPSDAPSGEEPPIAPPLD
jgi:proteasome alpha subunit